MIDFLVFLAFTLLALVVVFFIVVGFLVLRFLYMILTTVFGSNTSKKL